MLDMLADSEAAQDRYLLELYASLYRYAPGQVPASRIDDLVHDITCGVLEKLRNGTWRYGQTADEAFVRALLTNRFRNVWKSRRRAGTRDATHLEDREAMHPAWMAPDRPDEEERIAEAEARVLGTLPRRCRLAWEMVRYQQASYQDAAMRIGRAPATVHNYIVTVNRAFRDALPAESPLG
jgi:DNA-directed RNA polymerase specialized sigma24 family protein